MKKVLYLFLFGTLLSVPVAAQCTLGNILYSSLKMMAPCSVINITAITVPVTLNDGKWHHPAVSWEQC